MGIVRLLPETVQNKIAAGEVVERPASIVKELVENAVDAGARNVSVDLEGGGHRLVRVADDGSGMSEEDLLLSLERHATSKIVDVDDIFRIRSLGFRGEALPSIASVSRVAITTCLPGGVEASQILVEAGRIVRLSPAKRRSGTLVEVRDIFFNTPARRKFLRSPASDNSQSAEVLTRLALANPELGFRLQVDGLITFSVHPASSQLDRIADLFGSGLAGKLLPLARDVAEGVSLTGFIAAPPESRHNSSNVYFLVNRRWIRHFGLASAMAAVFRSALPSKKFPFAVVNLAIDPERLDVNVHPAKEEIRFANEDLVKKGICAAVKEALRDYAAKPPPTFFAALSPGGPPSGRRDVLGEKPRPPASFPPPTGRNEDFPRFDLKTTRERVKGWKATARLPGLSAAVEPSASGAARRSGATVPEGGYRLVGQVCGRYILIEGPDGLHFIDPHAWHERWNFDRLVAGGKRGLASERLLLPVEIALSPAEAAAIPEAIGALAEHGFDLALSGPGVLEVRAAPAYLGPANVETLIRQVIADVDLAGEAVGARREKLLASLACRSSVLLGKYLSQGELDEFIEGFVRGGQLPTCPHGRPAVVALSLEELTRRFGR